MEAPPPPDTRDLLLQDEAATRVLAASLARVARRRDVIALQGPLGAGKTAFARAFIAAIAAREGVAPPTEVPSPTFTLVQTYDLGRVTVWHFDLYRLSHADEAIELGLEEALAEGVSLIEWPDRLGPLIPLDRLEVELDYVATKAGARRARLAAHGAWRDRLPHVA